MNKSFFFDTADIRIIKNTWEIFSKYQQKDLVAGITTNPNAFSKVNLNSISEWRHRTQKLCELISNIRQDNKGIVYVQIPNSDISEYDFLKWIDIIKDFSDGNTQLGLKIAPKHIFLEKASLYPNLYFNVTGITNAATALFCLTYDIKYISLIPGRMQEIGLDWVSHAKQINLRQTDEKEIIFGSIRDLDELKKMFEFGIPTIGTKILDLIIEKKMMHNFNDDDTKTLDILDVEINSCHHKLSKDFFNQMDKLGNKIYNELLNVT